MTTILFVKKFDEDRLTSICKVIETDEPKMYVGQTLRVDLTVNADFDEMPEKTAGEKMMEEHQKPKQKDLMNNILKSKSYRTDIKIFCSASDNLSHHNLTFKSIFSSLYVY
jgi:hypothetical protein